MILRRGIVCLALLPAISGVIIASILMPCGNTAMELWGFALSFIIGVGAYRLIPWRNTGGWLTLIIAWALLCVGDAANLHQWTIGSGGSLTNPILENYDADLLFSKTQSLYNVLEDGDKNAIGGELRFNSKIHPAVPIYLIATALFGINLLSFVILNSIFILSGALITGVLAVKLIPDAATNKLTKSRVCTAAMILILAIAYWFNSGTLVIKDACVQWSTAALILGVVSIAKPESGKKSNLVIGGISVVALIFLTSARFQMLLMIAAACLFLLNKSNRNRMWMCFFMFIVVFFTYYYLNETVDMEYYVSEETVSEYYFQDRPMQRPYLSLLGDYAHMPVWRKLIWLPVSCVIQYFIPLPWNALRDIPMGVTLAYAHQGWIWYAEGGIALAFLMLYSWRKAMRNEMLSRLIWWAAAMWIVIAWLYAGTVSRYLLPFMPIFAVASLWCLLKVRCRKEFRAFYCGYLLLCALALIILGIMTNASIGV